MGEIKDKTYRERFSGLFVALIVCVVIVCDQWLKIWVKTHFYLGEDVEITPWWHIKFIENNGMAFGMELWSKLFLTLGRICVVGALIWFIVKALRFQNLRKGFFVAMALILAGAAGNIFDCVLYGEIFNNPLPPEVATLFSEGGGYAPWFEGRVVDMLYFPFFTIVFPESFPLVGGTSYEFFQYIFNIADSSICVGVFLLILFYSKDISVALSLVFDKKSKSENESKEEK